MRLILFCHIPEFFGEEDTTDGDMGGVEVGGRSIADDELRVNGLRVAAMSTALAERDLGEGMAEPVEAYNGRKSSCL